MREAGNVRELDVASEQAFAEEAKLDLRLAEIALRESREQLNALMGLWGEETQAWAAAPARLSDPPREPLDSERLESRAIERSLDLAAAGHLIAAAAENVGLDRASADRAGAGRAPAGTRATSCARRAHPRRCAEHARPARRPS